MISVHQLSENHRLLLCKADPQNASIQPQHGRVGAVVDNGNHFITSPYQKIHIPAPLFTSNVQLRADYTFGPDDPICWPQMYSALTCHFSVIKARPSSIHPDSIWWDPLRDYHFMEVSQQMELGSIPLGRVSPILLDLYQEGYETVARRAAVYVNKIGDHIISIILNLSNLLSTSHSQLRNLTFTFHQAALALSKFQHEYLELLAALDWIETYKPIMYGSTTDTSALRYDIVGTFLSQMDLEEAGKLFAAGIPYWIVRPVSELTLTRVDTLSVLFQPESRLCMTPEESSNILLTCAFGEKEKFTKMAHYLDSAAKPSCQNCNPQPLSQPRPMASTKLLSNENTTCPMATTSTSNASLGDHDTAQPSELPKKRPKRHRVRPYERLEKHLNGKKGPRQIQHPLVHLNTSVGIGSYLEPIHELFPIAATSWQDALKLVKRGTDEPPAKDFIFPDPKIFAAVQHVEARDRMLIRYLKWRSLRLSQLSSSMAQPIPDFIWKIFLRKGAGAESNASKRNAFLRAEIRKMIGIDDGDYESKQRASWMGQDIDEQHPLDNRMRQEILWELSELNFRLDLGELNEAMKPMVAEEFEGASVMDCFIGNDVTDIHPAQALSGLACATLAGRAPYLISLCKLMSFWRGGENFRVAREKTLPSYYTQQELQDIEHDAARFYTQCHWDVFARSPSLPRRLD